MRTGSRRVSNRLTFATTTMGLFDRFFGKKPASYSASLPEPAPEPPPFDGLKKTVPPAPQVPFPPPQAQPPEPEAPAGPEMMQVHDAYGRRIQIPRQQWLETVVMTNIEKAWSDPDKLAGMIMGAFNDGFFSEMTAPAERLAEIDPNPQRGATLVSICYLRTKRVDDAERVLNEHIAQHGESGVILTNLAKVHAERQDEQQTIETLWRALELDPNQENAVQWHAAAQREIKGEEGELKALKDIAALKGSWRAQLWLARRALQRGALDEALAFYRESLAHAGTPAPTDLLMQMSGDLGRQAHILELLELTAPRFQAEHHGIMVGNNILKAYVDVGQIESARLILNQLYALQRPDWADTLKFWDAEIAKSTVQTMQPDPDQKIQLAMGNIDGPVWLNPSSPAAELFPVREEGGPTISFLCASVGQENASDKPEHQLADAAGRLSRALPLFWAEQMHWRSDAQVTSVIPRVLGAQGAFAVMGSPWRDEDAAHLARQGGVAYDYVVTTHITVSAEICRLEVRVIRTIDGSCVQTLEGTFAKDHPEALLPKLTEDLYATLLKETEASPQAENPAYQVPTGPALPIYLIRLEQLLGVRCAATEQMQSGFLHGERDILDGMIQLVLAVPQSISVRVLLIQCLQTMKRVRPEILPEFESKVTLLQSQHPLEGVAQGVTDRLLREVFAAK